MKVREALSDDADAARDRGVRCLSEEEQRRAFAAIEGARKLQAEMLKARGGRRLPNSAELIREMREERTRELMRALEE